MSKEGDVLRQTLAEELALIKRGTNIGTRAVAVSSIVVAATFLVLTESVVAYLERQNVH